MLELCAKNGVDEMIATPHFYTHEDKVDRFLQRRQQAYRTGAKERVHGAKPGKRRHDV